jgi:predicted negative regulator of RcsB-dependent stress response
MAFDLEEQEELEALKAWWGRYGMLVTIFVVVAALTTAGIFGWRAWQHRENVRAGTFYAQLVEASGSSDHKKVADIAHLLEKDYPRTRYAAMAALASAHAAFDANDLKEASAQLQWAVDHAKEAELRDVARLRLAGVLLDQKNYKQALKLLDEKHAAPLDELYADRKGDVLAAQGDVSGAKNAYQVALDKAGSGNAYHNVIQLKLDALGSAK